MGHLQIYNASSDSHQAEDIDEKDVIDVIVDTVGSDLAKQDDKDIKKGIRNFQHLYQRPIRGRFSPTSMALQCTCSPRHQNRSGLLLINRGRLKTENQECSKRMGSWG